MARSAQGKEDIRISTETAKMAEKEFHEEVFRLYKNRDYAVLTSDEFLKRAVDELAAADKYTRDGVFGMLGGPQTPPDSQWALFLGVVSRRPDVALEYPAVFYVKCENEHAAMRFVTGDLSLRINAYCITDLFEKSPRLFRLLWRHFAPIDRDTPAETKDFGVPNDEDWVAMLWTFYAPAFHGKARFWRRAPRDNLLALLARLVAADPQRAAFLLRHGWDRGDSSSLDILWDHGARFGVFCADTDVAILARHPSMRAAFDAECIPVPSTEYILVNHPGALADTAAAKYAAERLAADPRRIDAVAAGTLYVALHMLNAVAPEDTAPLVAAVEAKYGATLADFRATLVAAVPAFLS